jgi:drug/metabolite transporter (DMT)-like permease
VGVALGLGAALSWGLADYFAAVASRSIGALRVVLGFHLAALIPLTGLVLATDALARVSVAQVALFVLIGAIGWLSYLAFYGALAIGPISVLSPIVSGYAVVTVLLAVVIGGNRLSLIQATAVGITIAGTMFASADLRQLAKMKLEGRSALGFVLAVAAMALLGAFVFGVSYFRPQIGWLAPIFMARGFAAAFVLGHILAARRGRPEESPRPSSGRTAAEQRKLIGIMVVLALLDTGGYVCFNVGVGHAATAIVAAASAPYAIVPIVMGVSLLRERPKPAQWVGIGLVIGGVIILGAVG